jgi:hypothetical protein
LTETPDLSTSEEAAGNRRQARQHLEQAQQLAEQLAKSEEQALILNDLKTIL